MSPWLGFLLAVLVEVPILLVATMRFGEGMRLRDWAALGVGVNCVTYFPFLGAVALLGRVGGRFPSLVVLELVVATIEGVLYARAGALGARRGLTISAVANAASFGAGLLLGWLR